MSEMLPRSVAVRKQCSKCNATKPLAEFHAGGRTSSGKQSWCKECKKQVPNRYVPRERLPRACEECNETFVGRRSDSRYCDQCRVLRNKYNRVPFREFPCGDCGELVITRWGTTRYCESCSKRHRDPKPPREKQCEGCQIQIVVRRRDQRFCDSCKANGNTRPPLREKHCEECHRSFTPNHGSVKFCSDECRVAVRNKKAQAVKRLRFGLTDTEFDRLAAAGCPICRTHEPGGRHDQWHMDHDHDCDYCKNGCPRCFRGLLCDACNKAIGLLRDDPRILRSGADYLEQPAQLRLVV